MSSDGHTLTMSTPTTNTSNLTSTLTSNDDDSADEWMNTTPRIVFLSVFICVGFFGNLLLIITVCQSKSFRNKSFFVFVINLAVVNIFECSINMSILLATSILNEWTFGYSACKMSSFCLSLILIETILGLTITTIDRFVAVRFKENYGTVISNSRIAVLITVTWVQSFSFSVPIAVGKVNSNVNNYIMVCAVSKGSSIVYNIITVALCFLLPFILITVFFIKIIRTGYKERFNIRNATAQQSYNEEFTDEPQLKQDIRHAGVTGTLCIAWLILEGPHVVTSYYSQLTSSQEVQDLTSEQLRYVWYVDLVLLWLRFSYAMALPITAFTWNKELWKCFKDFILCRKNNSVIDESFKKAVSDTLRLDRKIREEKMKEKESILPQRDQRVFQVPVLFATSHGVHVKTFDDDEESDAETDDNSNKTGTLKGKKCDVIGSRNNLNNVEDDTSDYDSGNEIDPFSVSHPISVRHINETGLSDRKRSLSEPEVREKGTSGGKRKTDDVKNNVSATTDGDSGLDLSTLPGSNSNSCKSTFHVPCDKLMLQNTQQLQTEILEPSAFKTHGINKQSNSDTQNYSELPLPLVDNQNEHSTSQRENENEVHNCDKSSTYTSPKKKKSPKGVDQAINNTDSPLPKRKKKKRRDKAFDSQSITSMTSNCSSIPPRPPPRLAPISNAFGVKSLYSNTGRPGSSCSSQCSILDNNFDAQTSLRSDSVTDIAKTDVMSFDNVSVSSFNMHRGGKSSKFRQCAISENGVESLQLDCKREIESVPEEILTPSDVRPLEKGVSETNVKSENMNTSYNGIVNGGFEKDSDEDGSPVRKEATPTTSRNTEARRKRREKLSATRDKLSHGALLTDGHGYQRLVPETP
ncbi:uncharacterized protein LOC128210277 [Mya arenaria]|uniref:uncharacterized protein LOC128210277 n=1 Tax=Mya arenaria TaxID=6604 RepID=UPI0022E16A21|nr:uncharacterized protein LOC128210277 [Mya arenaria]